MSKTPGGNKKTVGSIRARANMPAKAGRRKVYGNGSKRKTKHFGMGNGFMMTNDTKGHHGPSALLDVARAKGLRLLHSMEQMDNLPSSDPFKWARIYSHFLNGVVTLKDIEEKTFA